MHAHARTHIPIKDMCVVVHVYVSFSVEGVSPVGVYPGRVERPPVQRDGDQVGERGGRHLPGGAVRDRRLHVGSQEEQPYQDDVREDEPLH